MKCKGQALIICFLAAVVAAGFFHTPAAPPAPENTGVWTAPIYGISVPTSIALDTHGQVAGHSKRVQGYGGVSGGGAGPRRVLQRFRGLGTWIVARIGGEGRTSRKRRGP